MEIRKKPPRVAVGVYYKCILRKGVPSSIFFYVCMQRMRDKKEWRVVVWFLVCGVRYS